jgi:4-hydroxy-2-oxoheptanedioate aldolase
MEHGPMDFEGLHRFTVGMIDKATILKKGNAQPNVAIFARFAPYGREQAQWFVKQALDIGLMGVIFNGIDNPEQALLAVRNMRYPQRKTSKYPEPPGLRGYAPAGAVWWWGIPEGEYERRADLWPLNPDGDLLAIVMIETTEGLKNADAIAASPGVGAIFVGAGADLSQYLGVERNSPELEQALQTILKACLAHNVACGITALSAGEIARRLEEGWKMIRTTEAALNQWRSSTAAR